MTPERARDIWQTRTPFGGVSCSAQEDAYVRTIWRRMPGTTCWADALLAIANGTAPDKRPDTIGSVAFWYGNEIVEQVPIYVGESPEDPAIVARAQRHIDLLDIPPTGRRAMLHQAIARFYPKGH